MNMQSLVPLAQNPSLIPLFLCIPLTFRFSQNPKPRWRSLCWERRLFKKFRTVLSLSRHKYLYFANQSLNRQSSVYYLYRCPRSKFSQAPSLICYWRMDNFGHIEQVIIIEILSRLPVKSLLRFKCVCKSWLSTITSSSFVYEHFNMALADCKKAQVLISLYHLEKRSFNNYCVYLRAMSVAPYLAVSLNQDQMVGTVLMEEYDGDWSFRI